MEKKRRTISEKELKDILDKHGKWLRGEENGERANLSSADLSSANLRSADLRSADLRSADLRSADLRSANLSSANLRSADLRSADLRSADLRSANLSSANLRYANGFKFVPIQIANTNYFISILDDRVLWGCRTFTFDELKALTIEGCNESWDKDVFNFDKKLITDVIDFYRKAEK